MYVQDDGNFLQQKTAQCYKIYILLLLIISVLTSIIIWKKIYVYISTQLRKTLEFCSKLPTAIVKKYSIFVYVSDGM